MVRAVSASVFVWCASLLFSFLARLFDFTFDCLSIPLLVCMFFCFCYVSACLFDSLFDSVPNCLLGESQSFCPFAS